jgi:hypothetical protein
MSGRRAAAIALSLVMDLADRLDAAGVTPETAPSLDECVDLVWPPAKQLARLERSAKKADKSAGRARTAVLDSAVTRWMARTQPREVCQQQTSECHRGRPRWRKFDPEQWRVELVPHPAADREREVA